MNINAIKDAVKALAQSLQVTTIFPAGLLVLVNAYLVLPQVCPDLDPATPSAVTVMASLTLMLSYTLYAFNFPLIRLLEGYKLQEADLLQWLLKRQRGEFDALVTEIRELWARLEECRDYFDRLDKDDIPGDEQFFGYRKRWQQLKARLPRLERRFELDYPSVREMVLPTKLGNTIAAFEDYPRTRYGMDSIALWARLIPILKEENYLEFVSMEKAVFDFLMNTCIVTVVLGLELIYLNLFRGKWGLAVFITGLVGVAVAVLYHGMIIAARQWGTTVRVAFDLYRHDLHRRLGLRAAGNFRDERERWQAVSQFFLYRRKKVLEEFNEFIPQSEWVKLREAEKSCPPPGSETARGRHSASVLQSERRPPCAC